MKFIGRRAGQKEDEDLAKTAFIAPCAKCSTDVEVSQFTAQIWETTKTICKTKGWKPIERNELVLCSGCYRNHQDDITLRIEQENKAAEAWWEAFVKAWPTKRADERPKMENELRRKWPQLGSRLAAWVSRQLEARGKTKRDTDSAAGFE